MFAFMDLSLFGTTVTKLFPSAVPLVENQHSPTSFFFLFPPPPLVIIIFFIHTELPAACCTVFAHQNTSVVV